MTINLDKALGIHPQALKIREQRAEILANNLSNANTPGFKARDLDFHQMLKQVERQHGGQMLATNPQHLKGSSSVPIEQLRYRIPLQPSLDGNTVDQQVEVAQFSQNAVQYQASLNFLSGKFKSLISAFRGE